MVGDDVHDAGYAARIGRDSLDGGVRKELPGGGRHALTAIDVLTNLLGRHRCQPAPQADALFQLSQLRPLKLFIQFRLP